MDNQELLDKLKRRIGITDTAKEALLLDLLEDAENDILGWTKRDRAQWLPFFDVKQLDVAVLRYNNLGMEGLADRREGEISTSFDDGLAKIRQEVLPYRIRVAKVVF